MSSDGVKSKFTPRPKKLFTDTLPISNQLDSASRGAPGPFCEILSTLAAPPQRAETPIPERPPMERVTRKLSVKVPRVASPGATHERPQMERVTR